MVLIHEVSVEDSMSGSQNPAIIASMVSSLLSIIAGLIILPLLIYSDWNFTNSVRNSSGSLFAVSSSASNLDEPRLSISKKFKSIYTRLRSLSFSSITSSKSDSSKKIRLPFRIQLIFLLIFSDFMRALPLLWVPAWFLATGAQVAAPMIYSPSTDFCIASGFLFIYFARAGDVAILCIAFHSLISILKPVPDSHQGGLYRFRYLVYALWIGLPVITTTIVFIADSPRNTYVFNGCLCSFTYKHWVIPTVVLWIPRFLIFFVILIIYTGIYVYSRYIFHNVDKQLALNQNVLPPGRNPSITSIKADSNNDFSNYSHVYGNNFPPPFNDQNKSCTEFRLNMFTKTYDEENFCSDAENSEIGTFKQRSRSYSEPPISPLTEDPLTLDNIENNCIDENIESSDIDHKTIQLPQPNLGFKYTHSTGSIVEDFDNPKLVENKENSVHSPINLGASQIENDNNIDEKTDTPQKTQLADNFHSKKSNTNAKENFKKIFNKSFLSPKPRPLSPTNWFRGNNNIENSDIYTTTLEFNEATEKRKIIKRQLNYVFIYPAAYMLLWGFPLVNRAIAYYRAPPLWINILEMITIPLACFIDVLVYVMRESPANFKYRMWFFTVFLKLFNVPKKIFSWVLKCFYKSKTADSSQSNENGKNIFKDNQGTGSQGNFFFSDEEIRKLYQKKNSNYLNQNVNTGEEETSRIGFQNTSVYKNSKNENNINTNEEDNSLNDFNEVNDVNEEGIDNYIDLLTMLRSGP